MKPWFKNTRYIVLTGIYIALLMCISFITIFFKTSDGVFQLTSGFYLALCVLMPGPSLLVVGIVYGTMLDAIAGGFIFIPLTILINILMFLIMKCLSKYITVYGAIVLAAALVFIYIPYTGLVYGFDHSVIIKALVTDSIQFVVTILVGIIIYKGLSAPNIKKHLFEFNNQPQ
ncbi:hypothetical protein [Mesoplasma seiffertii]|uniref:hypothetical protein n=1 Tax=Mesoplasma seiffertii TaxID=28224 RepID=UPI000478E935|nr:hypothetical protein [Mesoplasma seiffertii]